MTRGRLYCLVLSLVVLTGVQQTGANPKTEARQARDEVYKMWHVDSMIQQAADNVARRYNLNADQTEFTRKMMYERVTQFLDENEEAIWPLVRDLARQQLKGEWFDETGSSGDLQAAKRIGQSALPLVEKARQAIVEANKEWGDILSDEQKRLHEYDLREMEGQFAQINNNFQGYIDGKPSPGIPMFPQHVQKADEPPRPKPPTSVKAPSTDRREHLWDRYVQGFIRKYKLDTGQEKSANSILREMKKRAKDYESSKDKEFKAVAKRFDEAVRAGDPKKRGAAMREEAVLKRPFDDMFKELKQRLDRIPRTAQKKAYEKIAKKKVTPKRPAKAKTRAGRKNETKPSPAAE
ncbi:MAG: hypothetical protein GY842_06375 [bacterium]|nr:hypothetical protein [bacterium]